MLRRRQTLQGIVLLLASLSLLPAQAEFDPHALRIGYQKSAAALGLLRTRGTLEKLLAPRDIRVKWVEFPAGPQLLEGLNVGSVDFGYVGEAPPIFAQAAGASFVYVGNELAAPAGLQYTDIQPVFLPPADARAAFERGSVDAWVIWEPFLSTRSTRSAPAGRARARAGPSAPAVAAGRTPWGTRSGGGSAKAAPTRIGGVCRAGCGAAAGLALIAKEPARARKAQMRPANTLADRQTGRSANW